MLLLGIRKGRAVPRWWGRGALIAVAALVCVALGSPAGAEVPEQLSALEDGDRSDFALPEILSSDDVERYETLFEATEAGDWRLADRLVRRLENKVLLGHVLAERFLHPTRFRASYKDLKGWLDSYADHPDARRIHALALKRKPRNWKAPKSPEGMNREAAARSTRTLEAGGRPAMPRKALSEAERDKVRLYQRRIRHYLGQGWTKSARKVIDGAEVRRLFSAAELDAARADLGFSYFLDGRDDWALQLAGSAARRSGRHVPQAHWTAGLAAWRLGRLGEAAGHFEKLAVAPGVSPWMVSSAAFWAARAHLVDRRPEKVGPWLARAAEHPRTFYGLLATYLRGEDLPFDWEEPPLGDRGMRDLLAEPAVSRALALLQIGEVHAAERELRHLMSLRGPAIGPALLGLASRARLAGLTLRLSRSLHGEDGPDAAAYPLPAWEPDDGFTVDRALVYALMRQESAFNPAAKSHAGARGLLQIMPGTASFVANDRIYRKRSGRRALLDPQLNLELGQKYLRMLLDEPAVEGDLVFLAASWNGGPGNLAKWRRRDRHDEDALLFMESIPLRETRDFVERVLTNLWIYRHRLGQPIPSLEAIASGGWPAYMSLDGTSTQVARHGENRR